MTNISNILEHKTTTIIRRYFGIGSFSIIKYNKETLKYTMKKINRILI